MGRKGQHRGVRLTRRRPAAPDLPGVAGPARLARPDPARHDSVHATRALARRLHPGDIAVIDHLDLDRVSAEALVAAGAAAVVNVRPSLSGRHPAHGAAVVVGAGIPLVDDVGVGLLSAIRDGQPVRLDDGELYPADSPAADPATIDSLAHGTVRTEVDVDSAEQAARVGMGARLESIGGDTAAVVHEHEALLLEGAGLPDPGVEMLGRHVLVVAPGERAAEEVRALRGYLAERRPVLVGADGGAAVLARAGHQPDLVVGDPGDPGGRSTRRHTAHRITRDELPRGFAATELAVLLAASGGADLVVLAGAPASYDDLLDRDRPASASALAVRLHAGSRLVDAAAVTALQRPALGVVWPLLLLVAGLLAVGLAFAATPVGADLLGLDWPW